VKRVALLCLLVSVFATVIALSEPVKVFPNLWDQDALKYPPSGPGYPVLAVTEVHDGDTFEALLHVAPQLIVAVDIRVDGVDTPEITGVCKEEGERVRDLVNQFLAGAGEIRVKLTGYSFGRWVCVVTVDGRNLAEWIIENGLTKADLCEEGG